MKLVSEIRLTRRKLVLDAALTIASVDSVVTMVQEPAIVKSTYTYKTVHGCAIRADVHRRACSKTLPAVLWIHGGALIMGNRGGINTTQLRRYVDAGFTVVAIDYRLAPETKLPEILTDVEDAYRWVKERGPSLFQIDPGRVGVVGHSAGGYLTLTAGYRWHPRPRALVAFYGYGDIAGGWYSRPDPYYSKQPAIPDDVAWSQVGKREISETSGDRDKFYLYTRQHGLWPKLVAGLDPDTQNKAFDPYCPLRNITPEYPPTLLLHGDKDTDVPYGQSELMLRELKRHGVDCEMITIKNAGHGFDHAMDDLQVSGAFDRVIQFLRMHLS